MSGQDDHLEGAVDRLRKAARTTFNGGAARWSWAEDAELVLARLADAQEALHHVLEEATERWQESDSPIGEPNGLAVWLGLNCEQYAMYVEGRMDDLAAALSGWSSDGTGKDFGERQSRSCAGEPVGDGASE